METKHRTEYINDKGVRTTYRIVDTHAMALVDATYCLRELSKEVYLTTEEVIKTEYKITKQ